MDTPRESQIALDPFGIPSYQYHHKDYIPPKEVDAWIEAMPENVYDPCPCGCGKKFKFCKDDIAKHENQFYKNLWKAQDNT